ncbi:hypothetical protein FTO70_09610 [Methanosarcina sp. KYL-1]|uniref:hypothetical protein n=1 Tax=Methanosarcina sp. KYL-1 TaxID=2602068 RepID=UPI002101CF12|nr:hypothetical protein [Methanosarcina sp. KYL-1]MCQ1535931.1 hypothetical protein [Methanosarcina sp. KYL-1]
MIIFIVVVLSPGLLGIDKNVSVSRPVILSSKALSLDLQENFKNIFSGIPSELKVLLNYKSKIELMD